MTDFTGRVVVVTGGASGVGRGIAEAFAAAGAKLVIADVNPERLAETEETLVEIGAEVLTCRTDIREFAQVEALADESYARFGAVHVLCNNAGVACNGVVWEHSQEDWDWVFDTNVRGTVNGLRVFVPRLIEQQDRAHVVNTSSMLGLSSAPLTGVYGASKQTVLAISEALRLDLGLLGANVGVSVLCPGPVATNVGEEPGRPPVDSTTVPDAVAAVNTALREVVANGMDPRGVGDCVVDAVREDRFWILPAPEFFANAEARLEEIRSTLAG